MAFDKTEARSTHSPSFRKINEHTIRISDDIALRITSDTKPYRWKTAELQKGLILIHNGREMAGEGTGFGVPVLQYPSDMYFSGESKLLLAQSGKTLLIRKEFLMDRVPKRKIGNSLIQNRILLAFWRYLAELYMKHRLWRFIIHMSISRRVGVHTRFAKVDPVGKVVLTYVFDNNRIRVLVDLGLVEKKDLQSIFLLNEQGSDFFRSYSDSNGTRLHNNKIGAWDVVKAANATMADAKGKVGFRLSQIEGGILRRGREYIKGSQDWAGLDYTLTPNSKETFEYEIETLMKDTPE